MDGHDETPPTTQAQPQVPPPVAEPPAGASTQSKTTIPFFTLFTFSRATGGVLGVNNYPLTLATTISDDWRHDKTVAGLIWLIINEDTFFGADNKGSQDIDDKAINTILNLYGILIDLDTKEGLGAIGHNNSTNSTNADVKWKNMSELKSDAFGYRQCFRAINNGGENFFYVFDVCPLRGNLLLMINQKLDSASSSWRLSCKQLGLNVDNIIKGELIFIQEKDRYSAHPLFPFTAIYNYDILLFFQAIIDTYPDNPGAAVAAVLLGLPPGATAAVAAAAAAAATPFDKAKQMNLYCMNYLWQRVLLRCYQDVFQDSFLKQHGLQEHYLIAIESLRHIYFTNIKGKDMDFYWKIKKSGENVEIFQFFTKKFKILTNVYYAWDKFYELNHELQVIDNQFIKDCLEHVNEIANLEGMSITDVCKLFKAYVHKKDKPAVVVEVEEEEGNATALLALLNNEEVAVDGGDGEWIFAVSQSAVSGGILANIGNKMKKLGKKMAGLFNTLKPRNSTSKADAQNWSKGIKILATQLANLQERKDALDVAHRMAKNSRPVADDTDLLNDMLTITKYTGDTSHVTVSEILCDMLRNVENHVPVIVEGVITAIYNVLAGWVWVDQPTYLRTWSEMRVILQKFIIRVYLSERPLAARVLTNWPQCDRKMQYVIAELSRMVGLYTPKAEDKLSTSPSKKESHRCFFISHPDPAAALANLLKTIEADKKYVWGKEVNERWRSSVPVMPPVAATAVPSTADEDKKKLKELIDDNEYKLLQKKKKNVVCFCWYKSGSGCGGGRRKTGPRGE